MENTDLNDALKKIDIEDYANREGLDYRPSYGTRGLQLNLRECPVCGKAEYKVYINAENGLGNCFHGACMAKFNKFTLIKNVSKLAGAPLRQHIDAVAQEQGWMPKRVKPKIIQGKLTLPSSCLPLPIEGGILPYLANRGVDARSCEEFSLSYCHKGWWSCLIDNGEKQNISFDQRVVAPILDIDGVMVSFQARDITGEKIPKYLFPKGFAVSGSHIYNANNFEDGVTTHLVVGEGIYDAIAITQALRPYNTKQILGVCTFGMHLSSGPDGQLNKFSNLKERGLRRVTLMWDSEKAAIAQAVKAGAQIAGLGIEVRVAILPTGADPAQLKDGTPTPVSVLLGAITNAKKLTKTEAMRLLVGAK